MKINIKRVGIFPLKISYELEEYAECMHESGMNKQNSRLFLTIRGIFSHDRYTRGHIHVSRASVPK